MSSSSSSTGSIGSSLRGGSSSSSSTQPPLAYGEKIACKLYKHKQPHVTHRWSRAGQGPGAMIARRCQ